MITVNELETAMKPCNGTDQFMRAHYMGSMDKYLDVSEGALTFLATIAENDEKENLQKASGVLQGFLEVYWEFLKGTDIEQKHKEQHSPYIRVVLNAEDDYVYYVITEAKTKTFINQKIENNCVPNGMWEFYYYFPTNKLIWCKEV